MRKPNIQCAVTAEDYSETSLGDFIPVGGYFVVCDKGDGVTEQAVADYIASYLSPPFPVGVKVFNEDGTAIKDEVPAVGTFVATRIRTT